MKKEKVRIEKRHISNANLAKTEKWLRDQAEAGWKLSEVKMGILRDTFVFIKCKPCDNAYFSHVFFYKLPKLQNTSFSVIDYIKSTYGGKKLSPKDYNGWICLKISNITDVDDVRNNLIYRENCIRTEYIIYFTAFLVPAIIMLLVGIFARESLPFYGFPSFIGAISAIPAVKLVLHKKNCKEAYTDFLKSSTSKTKERYD